MPPHFVLTFYLWKGVGEFKLYDPLADTPLRLFNNSQNYNPDDYEAMYQAIYENKPDLALVVLSIVPGESPVRLPAVHADADLYGRHPGFAQEGHRRDVRHAFRQLPGRRQHGIPDQLSSRWTPRWRSSGIR